MPWYTNPGKTCKFLDKIASRYEPSALQELNSALDNILSSILKKQENYFAGNQQKPR